MTNNDKRSVFTDALETLGNIIDENQKRDAIHLAVEPVVAKATLFPGQDVSADGSPEGKHVGIVDPFLERPVSPGERFWLVIYPRKIKSLRHVWTHPDFPEVEISIEQEESNVEVEKSKRWMRDFVEETSGWEDYEDCADEVTYEMLMEAANDFLKDGGYFSMGGKFEGHRVPDEFWDHYEVITGKRLEDDQKKDFFSCSC